MDKISMKFLKYSMGMIVCFFTIMSFLFSQRLGQEDLGEFLNGAPIYEVKDNILFHIGGIIVVVSIFCLIDKLCRTKNIQDFKLKVYQIVVAFLCTFIAFGIYAGGQRTPIDDQIQVIGAAQLFNEGNYTNLMAGGYVNMYPHQLGYISYLKIIFKLFGNGNYFAVQTINCIFIGGISYGISLIINMLTKKVSCRIIGTLSTLVLFPVYMMNSWVYGDVPCLFFCLMLVYYYFRFCKNPTWKNSVFMLVFSVLSVVFRKNSLIILIALFVVSVIQFIKSRHGRLLLVVGMTCVIPILCTRGISTYYEQVSGYEIEGGIPSMAWITMGSIEGHRKPGWFNNYCATVYANTQYDRELSAQIAQKDFIEQMKQYIDNPAKTISFYKRKICTQWNDPFYGTSHMLKVDEGVDATGLTKYLLQNMNVLRDILSVMQFILYCGFFLYLMFCLEKGEFYHCVITVIIFGGFLFSILWEANSRYVVPYCVMMVPLAVLGWAQFCCIVSDKIKMI